jgi:hypothetical protein
MLTEKEENMILESINWLIEFTVQCETEIRARWEFSICVR